MLTVLNGDCRDVLKQLPDNSVHCCVTSPPYWGLRDYGTARWEGGREDCDHRKGHSMATSGLEGGKTTTLHNHYHRDQCPCGARRIDSQLGLEQSPEQYVAEMVAIFREVRRVLRSDGTLWLNLGDSYAGSGRGPSELNPAQEMQNYSVPSGLKPKDLCGIPWMLAFALRADGWYLRSEIIWAKPNPMPESVTDRPTKAHEQVFLLAKSSRYFYDAEAIREEGEGTWNHGGYRNGRSVYLENKSFDNSNGELGRAGASPQIAGRNRRSVWTIATAPYSDAHFATFPPKLVEPCVLAGTSARGCCAECGAPWERVVERTTTKQGEAYDDRMERWGDDFTPAHQGGRSFQVPIRYNISQSEATTTGWQPTCTHLDADVVPCVVLDPFAGSGTVGAVALAAGRRAVLIELNPKYCEMIERRNQVTLGLPGLA